MINIRESIFETNSSSEHAVCVNIGGYITFDKELDEYTEEFYRKHKKHPEPKDPNSPTMMDFDITCYTEEGKVKLSFEDVDYHEVFDMVWKMKNS